MKISMNVRIVDGPWGGANQLVKAIKKHIVSDGHELISHLEPGIDVILIFSSRKISIMTYDIDEIARYKQLNPKTIVINRVNGIDGQRATNIDMAINKRTLAVDKFADGTIFVSDFIREYYAGKLNLDNPNAVILNGSDPDVFNPIDGSVWQEPEKMKLVTHHWSTNPFKGFDLYKKVHDKILNELSEEFEFEIIGRHPPELYFSNVVPAINGVPLARALKRNHVYITASKLESGPNHPVEAISCGLPILYMDSGSMAEYCSGYGVEYKENNWHEALLELKENYNVFRQKCLNHNFYSKDVWSQYSNLISEIAKKM